MIAPNHYLNKCWPRSMPSYEVTRPQWVNWNDGLVESQYHRTTIKTSSFSTPIQRYFTWNCDCCHLHSKLTNLQLIYNSMSSSATTSLKIKMKSSEGHCFNSKDSYQSLHRLNVVGSIRVQGSSKLRSLHILANPKVIQKQHNFIKHIWYEFLYRVKK